MLAQTRRAAYLIGHRVFHCAQNAVEHRLHTPFLQVPVDARQVPNGQDTQEFFRGQPVFRNQNSAEPAAFAGPFVEKPDYLDLSRVSVEEIVTGCNRILGYGQNL